MKTISTFKPGGAEADDLCLGCEMRYGEGRAEFYWIWFKDIFYTDFWLLWNVYNEDFLCSIYDQVSALLVLYSIVLREQQNIYYLYLNWSILITIGLFGLHCTLNFFSIIEFRSIGVRAQYERHLKCNSYTFSILFEHLIIFSLFHYVLYV